MSQQDPKKPQFPLMRPDNDRNRQQRQRRGGGGDDPGNEPGRTGPRVPTWVVATIIIALVGWYIWNFFGPQDDPSITDVPYNVVTQLIEDGNVDRVTMSETSIRIELDQPVRYDSENQRIDNDAPLDNENIKETDDVEATLPQGVEITDLLDRVEETGATIVGRTTSTSIWTNLIFSFLPFLLFLGLIIFMSRQMGRGNQNVFGFGRSKARQNDPERPQVTFADVAGEDEAKQELMEVVDFLRNPAKYHALGARLPRGPRGDPADPRQGHAAQREG
jgi:cell division protease FtsH